MNIPISDVFTNEKKEPVLEKIKTVRYERLKRIVKPEDVAQIMMEVFGMDKQIAEVVYLVSLDNKGTPLGFFFLNKGLVNCSQVDIRGIFIRLLLTNAAQFIMVHNHTSGSPIPSREDMVITDRIKRLSAVMGIQFCDHIIIGNCKYFSFKEQLWSKDKAGVNAQKNNESEELLCLQD